MDGYPVSVYPIMGASYDREDALAELVDGELAVILSPDGDADCLVTSFDKNNIQPREPTLSFAALSFFFKAVRGYPKMTLDVKYEGRIHELPLTDDNVKISVNVGKSKILCAKTVEFADGTEITARAVNCGDAVITALCHDAELFDEGRLRLLLYSFLDKGARSTIAVSFMDKMRIKTVGKSFAYEAITAGVFTLSIEGIGLPDGECTCLVDGKEYVFYKDKGNLTFYPEIDCFG